MTTFRLALLGAFVAVFTTPASSQQASPSDVLKTLRAGHPRIYLTDADLARLKQRIATDATAKRWYDQLEDAAKRVLNEKPVEHVLIGPRLLDKSRTALNRIVLLALLYRLDGDAAKAERARKEMLAVCAFEDWNPSHFLDTAEMSHAVGVGYDWLFDTLSPEDRKTIREALVKLGLEPGLKVFSVNNWWAVATHNWNQVCNGGLTVGALAIADEEPEVASRIINKARKSIVLAMHTFAPDGGWPEGPGYWNYATSYNVSFLAACESALGTDFGLLKMPGFDVTGGFRMQSVGPIDRTFNYADAGDRAGQAPQMLYLARVFDHPEYARHEFEVVGKGRPSPWHLIYLAKLPETLAKEERPRDAVYRGIDVAFFRSQWDDPKAIFVGFKGGDNRANHSHLDLGTFVLDALGERWAVDLGSDEYNLPGYFGKQRWDYYRLRTEGHNTLTIGTDNQATKAKAPLLAFHSEPDRSFAVADLTAAYAPKLTKAQRGVALLDRRSVLVQDEFAANEPVEIVWNFHTRARIELKGAEAELTLGKARLRVRILAPADAKFAMVSANPPPPQAQQPDVQNLVIKLPEAQSSRIAVLFEPGEERTAPKIEPLKSWIAAGPLETK